MPTLPRDLGKVDKRLQRVFAGLSLGKLPWPLYLYGPVGVGKTCAALALCDWTCRRAYKTVSELMDAQMRRPGTEETWDTIATPCLFVLDELGAGIESSDFELRSVLKCADLRSTHAHGVAIYISNLPPEELQRYYDGRVYDRITSGTRFLLDGSSRRGRPVQGV